MGATIDNGTLIEVEGATTFSTAITFNGDNTTMETGPCCTFSGLVTLAGSACALYTGNGSSLVGVSITGQYGCYDGGGKDTVVDGTTLSSYAVENSGTSADVIIKNCTATSPVGQDTFRILGPRTLVCFTNTTSSGDDAYIFGNAGDNSLLLCNHCQGAASDAIITSSLTDDLVIANNIVSATFRGIVLNSTDVICVDNIVVNAEIDTSLATNNLVVSNRTDEAVTTGGTGNLISNNDTDTI